MNSESGNICGGSFKMIRAIKPRELDKLFDKKGNANINNELTLEHTTGDHSRWVLRHKGKIVSHVGISNSQKELGPGYLGEIKKKMRMSSKDFQEFLACTKTLEDWYSATPHPNS